MPSIILYSDQPILAQALQSVLTLTRSFRLHSVVTRMPALMEAMATEHPDIVLMDLTSEVTFAALSQMEQSKSHIKIVLWVHTISTELAFQAMGLGVRGILRKTLPIDLLIKGLEKIHKGELWFEKALTDSFLSANRVPLTQREGQLVSLLAQGLKNKEIATALLTTEGTVKVYLSRLFEKLGVKDRLELALYGLKNMTTGQGTIQGVQEDPVRAGVLPLANLRSIVLGRVPEKIPPAVSSIQNIRPSGTVRPPVRDAS
jgi:two-component system response regulator DesR